MLHQVSLGGHAVPQNAVAVGGDALVFVSHPRAALHLRSHNPLASEKLGEGGRGGEGGKERGGGCLEGGREGGLSLLEANKGALRARGKQG